MFDVSYEDGTWEGLGVIPGEVVRFQNQPDLKIPHIGWNRLDFVNGSSLLADVPAGSFFYFGHSYYVVPSDETVIVARSEHRDTVRRHGSTR